VLAGCATDGRVQVVAVPASGRIQPELLSRSTQDGLSTSLYDTSHLIGVNCNIL
jgi:hypothetical protein